MSDDGDLDHLQRILGQIGDEAYERDIRDEYKRAVEVRRRGRWVNRVRYPSDNKYYPCASCGRMAKRPHGYGWRLDLHFCPVCSKEHYRNAADAMGWKWPRQKPSAKKVVETLLELS